MYNPQLNTFLRVAAAGSFNKAAENMFITPPAVMKQINLLEASLGVKLFQRTHQGLLLTEAGKSMYGDVKYVIQYCSEAVVRAKNAMREDGQLIRIGTSPMTPGHFLLNLWPRIQERCPNIKFQLVPYENTPENAREILRSLGQKIDLVAGPFDQKLLEERGCAALELLRAPVRCGVSIYHPLAAKHELTVQDLQGETFMLIRRGWNSYLDAMRDELWARNPPLNIVDVDCFSLEVFHQCQANHHILMTIDAWEGVHPLLKVLPVDWSYTVPFGLFHAPAPSAAVQRFLDAVQDVYCF